MIAPTRLYTLEEAICIALDIPRDEYTIHNPLVNTLRDALVAFSKNPWDLLEVQSKLGVYINNDESFNSFDIDKISEDVVLWIKDWYVPTVLRPTKDTEPKSSHGKPGPKGRHSSTLLIWEIMQKHVDLNLNHKATAIEVREHLWKADTNDSHEFHDWVQTEFIEVPQEIDLPLLRKGQHKLNFTSLVEKVRKLRQSPPTPRTDSPA